VPFFNRKDLPLFPLNNKSVGFARSPQGSAYFIDRDRKLRVPQGVSHGYERTGQQCLCHARISALATSTRTIIRGPTPKIYAILIVELN
jgi:hypothetical protein